MSQPTKLILRPRCITSSHVFDFDGSAYVYRRTWRASYGYTIQRRLRSSNFLEHRDPWNWPRTSDVENYLKMNGGTFGSSVGARPIVHFESCGDADEVIRKHIQEELGIPF